MVTGQATGSRVALAAGGSTLIYYCIFGNGWHDAVLAVEHAIPGEYIPFIMLLFSLYVISGGISITGDLRATPMVNSMFLLVGTLIASFIGTTGASMLLIRPLLKTNRERKYKVHTVVMFIFLVFALLLFVLLGLMLRDLLLKMSQVFIEFNWTTSYF